MFTFKAILQTSAVQNQNKILEKCPKKHFLKRSFADVVKEDITKGMLI
jgi:hypothetical protein